jgi:hypothetical protein
MFSLIHSIKTRGLRAGRNDSPVSLLVLVRHGQQAARVSVEHWRTSRQWHPAVGRDHLAPSTSLWQDQRALELATKGAKPLGWVGVGVTSLQEAAETILNISRCSGKLSRSTNDAEGVSAGESSYTV